MTKSLKKRMLEQIRKNIETNGFHIYEILPGPCPRYIYTIGLYEKIGFELILAGASYIDDENAIELLQLIGAELLKAKSKRRFSKKLGRQSIEFELTHVDPTWGEKLVLGAADYYKTPTIKAMSLVIGEKYQTIDCADLSEPFDKKATSPWKWLSTKWPFPIPQESVAITNLDALFGKQLTEIACWENDTWAIFSGAGEKQPPSSIREVPMGTFLGIDPSLEFITCMKVEDGYWRNRRETEWQVWR
jgi:hypothetical protein